MSIHIKISQLPFFLAILIFISCQKGNSNHQDIKIDHDSISVNDSFPVDSFDDDDYFEEEKTEPVTEKEAGIILKPSGNYNTIRQQIAADRMWFREKYQGAVSDSAGKSVIDSAEKYLFNALLNRIIPHWYGTDWDFEGHTNTPNDGYIACGYFVSTTMKHAGYNLNRYRLAQQHSTIAIKTVELADTFINFGCDDVECQCEQIGNKLEDGLYMIGLSCHVGYILKHHGNIFFIHSSYLSPLEVVIDRCHESPALNSSTIYLMGRIFPNEALTKKWILNEEINVLTDN